MKFRVLLVASAAAASSACAGPNSAGRPVDDGFFTMPFADATSEDAAPAPPPQARQIDAYTVELSFEQAGGRRIAAPSVVTIDGRTASVELRNAPPGGASSDDESARRGPEGAWFSVCPHRAADGGVTLGFRVRLARMKAAPSAGDASPGLESVEFEGARWIEKGVTAELGRVTSPDGSGSMLVLAHVTSHLVDLPGDDDGSPSDDPLRREMSGHTRHLRLTAVAVPRVFEPGAVLDETATPDVMKSMDGRILRDYEVYTCVDARVRVAGLLDSGGAARGLVVTGRDDGRLDVSWTTSAGGRTASVRPNDGRRFVALSKLDGGGTAGVLVALDVD